GEEVVACVVPAGAVADPDALAAELQAKVRDEYSKHAYPRRVHFVDRLPKTPSGKLQRFLLRQGATD
ncbi:AMP-dependent synthetase, partial [Mesorhizobium sp. B2-6-6]